MKRDKSLDAKLVEAYQSGDKEALVLLVKRWHVTFCEKAFWLLKDVDVSKDIAQDTWQTIITKMATLKNPRRFGTWAIRIVYHKSIDVLNQRNREQLDLINYKYEQENPSQSKIDDSVIKDELLKAMMVLPKNQRQVLNLFYLESYSLKQISELLNISIGTAKSRLFYAREKLKEVIKITNHEK